MRKDPSLFPFLSPSLSLPLEVFSSSPLHFSQFFSINLGPCFSFHPLEVFFFLFLSSFPSLSSLLLPSTTSIIDAVPLYFPSLPVYFFFFVFFRPTRYTLSLSLPFLSLLQTRHTFPRSKKYEEKEENRRREVIERSD